MIKMTRNKKTKLYTLTGLEEDDVKTIEIALYLSTYCLNKEQLAVKDVLMKEIDVARTQAIVQDNPDLRTPA